MIKRKKQTALRWVTFAFFFGMAIALSSCGKKNRLIDKFTVEPSENLETVRISLIFAKSVKSSLTGGFAIKEYGYIFMNPFTQTEPFEVGFNLNTQIFGDQDFALLKPTQLWPNGDPNGITEALVEVRAHNPVSPNFDIYGYVDLIPPLEWLGTAIILNFMNESIFPAGLKTVTQVLKKDHQGKPQIIGSVFSPTLNLDGSLKKPGGFALLANVNTLISEMAGKRSLSQKALSEIYFSGPEADRYEKDPMKLEKFRQRFVSGLNGAGSSSGALK